MQPEEMPAAPSTPPSESWWPSLIAVALFVALLLGAYAGGLVLPVGDLAGPDSYMWLYLVETAHHSGDGLLYPLGGMESHRSNAPFGETLHWTLPFFALLYVPAWLGSALTGASFGDALFVWGVALGPLLLGATVLTMVWGLDPLLRRGERFVITLFLLMNAGVLLGFQVARPDHQALSLFLIALAVSLAMRMLRVVSLPTGAKIIRFPMEGLGLAAALVLALWVSADALILLFIVELCLFGKYIYAWHGRFLYDLLVVNAGAFGLSVVAMYLQPEAYQEVADTFGAYHTALLGGFFFFSLAFLFGPKEPPGLAEEDRLNGSTRVKSLFVLVMLGCGLFFFIGGAWNLLSPYSTMDERVREIWQQGVIESVPMGQLLFSMPGLAVLALGPVLAGGLYALRNWLFNDKDAADQRPAWILLAVGIGAYGVVSVFLQQRFFIQANLLAAGPFALLIWRGLDLEKKAMPLVKALLVGNAFALFGAGLFWLQAQIKPEATQAIAATQLGVPQRPEKPSPFPRSAPLSTFTSWLNELQGKPATILSFINIGPEILYRTPHSVVSTPYHRNNAGILAEYDFLSAPIEDLSLARRIARERKIDYVLLRPNQAEENAYYQQADRSRAPILRDVLLLGEPHGWAVKVPHAWDWLVEVPLPDHLAGTYRLFGVRQGQLSD